MSIVKGHKSFHETLSGFTVAQQRQVGARFVANVLGLTDNSVLQHAQSVAAKVGVSAEELVDAYHSVYAIYVRTHPRSDLSELDDKKQAAHFVAEALLLCLSPTYPEATAHRIAEKAALYCRMARTGSSVKHDEDAPPMGKVAGAMQQEIEAQYQIVNQFLG